MREDQQIPIPFVLPTTSIDGKITFRHDFENATYSLSNMGQKILCEVLARINSFEKAENQVIELTAAELDQLGIGFAKASIYRTFKKACEEVQSLKVVFIGEDNDWQYEGSINVFRGTVKKFKKNLGKPTFHAAYFSISDEAAPYLTELTRDMRFTQFLVEHIRPLKKAYSIRLYQSLRKNHWLTIRRPKTTVEISLDEIRLKLDFKNSYPVWKDFKKRILEVAVAEINMDSDLRCCYNVSKTGRGGKVLTLVFEIWNAEYFEPINDPEAKILEGELLEGHLPEIDENIKALIRSQLPSIEDSVLRMLAVYEKEIIMESLLAYAGQAATRKIKEPVGYFIGIITKKNKEHKSLAESKTHKTTEEKLSDRSWAEGLNLDAVSEDD